MEDWYDMLPTKNGKAAQQIQWSPTGYVRAKLASDASWKTAQCSKAEYAMTIGEQLITKGGTDEVRSLQKRQ
jgi:hypothetical protein